MVTAEPSHPVPYFSPVCNCQIELSCFATTNAVVHAA